MQALLFDNMHVNAGLIPSKKAMDKYTYLHFATTGNRVQPFSIPQKLSLKPCPEAEV